MENTEYIALIYEDANRFRLFRIMKTCFLKLITVCIIGCVVLLVLYPLQNKKNNPHPKFIQNLLNFVTWPQSHKLPVVDTSVFAGVRKKGLVKDLPNEDQIKLMDADSIWKTYHSYTDNIDILCERSIRMGHLGDGGWEICDDPPYRPIKPCIIYSFGINNDFSFDDDAIMIYECDVYSFDPSMIMDTQKRSNHSMFYKIGINGNDQELQNGWKMLSLTSIRKILNHTKSIIDVLKMDVESAEWFSLSSMFKSGELKTVRQLLVEFHTGRERSYNEGVPKLKLLSDIEKAGFRRFYTHKNAFCSIKISDIYPLTRSGCQEVHFVNTNVLQ